jgi:N-acetylglucosaminyldiphosphoundecaprenol N-acetyl-beta-D-mannosaminyltransferase
MHKPAEADAGASEKEVIVMKERLKILDIWVDPVTRDEAIGRVRDFLKYGSRPNSVFASNPEKNFSVPKDAELYEVFRDADLLIPDGIGIVLAARILHRATLERVPGSEFIFDICSLAEKEGYRIFIYGASEDVNQKSSKILAARYPRLLITGRANGYVSKAEMPQLIRRINESQAEILFVALGSPKQEKWFAEHKASLEHVRVVQGIGGTLDTVGGTVKRAPTIWRKYWAEWLYRLLSEPWRIKRQKWLPLFALMVLSAKISYISGRGGKAV